MRIIAGISKGVPIDAPKGRDTRPTLDRVREAIFGIIQFDVPGAVVFDGFAGSGALGLEALSRGAKRCIFAETAPKTLAVLRSNIGKLGYESMSAVDPSGVVSAIETAARQNIKFDIVLLDPPYAAGLYEITIRLLLERDVLAEDGIIVAEHPHDAPVTVHAGLGIRTVKKYGIVGVTVMERL